MGDVLFDVECSSEFDFIKVYRSSSFVVQILLNFLIKDEWMYECFERMSSIYLLLESADLLQKEYFDSMLEIANYMQFFGALCCLNSAGILSPENQMLIFEQEDTERLNTVLSCLLSVRLLNQQNFISLLQPQHASLLHSDFLDHLPKEALTQANFDKLILASKEDDPSMALTRVFNDISKHAHGVVLNPIQSTHTTSVHRSVARSLLKLKSSYGEKLNIDEMVSQVQMEINFLSDDEFVYRAAKRSITYLLQMSETVMEPLSKVSIRELLALVYCAIHDKSKRDGTLEDAKKLFIEGLFQIQRNDNLSQDEIEENTSEHLTDDPICPGGVFNKMMEKLSGIHADVSVIFVTSELASLKFPKILRQHTLKYLDEQSIKPNFDFLLKTLKKENGSIASIWPAIQSDVQETVWHEFSQAFSDNPYDKRFKDFFETGAEFSLSCLDLEEIEEKYSISLVSFFKKSDMHSPKLEDEAVFQKRDGPVI